MYGGYKMKYIKVNLNNTEERFIYSEKLKEFEKEFSYPLGNESFTIEHGIKNDYFSFFEQLGKVNYLVIEDNNRIIGAVAVILRKLENNTKTWYLCDFKISKKYRGLNLYKKLMMRFFLNFYLINKTMYAVNMNVSNSNKLHIHTQSIFKKFNIQIEKRFLSQFSKEEIDKLGDEFWDAHYLVTNMTKKDIVIKETPIQLYHVVKKTRHIDNASNINHLYIPENSQIMYLTENKLSLFENEIEISYIHKGNPGLYFSSAEI